MGFTLRKDDDEQAFWVSYPAADDESYEIRLLRPKDLDHLRKVATRPKWERGQRVDDLDRDRYNELLADHLIKGWHGVYVDEGRQQAAPCTLENKVLLMGASLERANFLVDQASQLANDDEYRQETARRSFRAVGQVPA